VEIYARMVTQLLARGEAGTEAVRA
jgi:hypothetical protein